MILSGQTTVSPLASALKAQATRSEIGVAVLKKAQDTMRQEGEAMVDLIEKAAPPQSLPEGYAGLDVYA